MSTVPTLLIVHIACAVVSPWLFSARVWRVLHGRNPAAGVLKWLPHTIDTVLLTAGVSLAWVLRLSPLQHPWLAAKIVAIVLYILAGHIAVRRARSRAQRIGAWAIALALIAYIYSVALAADPWPVNREALAAARDPLCWRSKAPHDQPF